MSFIGLRRSHQQLAERLDAQPLVNSAAKSPQDSNPPSAVAPAPPPTDPQGTKSNPPVFPAPAPAPAPAPVPAPAPAPGPASFQSNPFFGAPTDTIQFQPISTAPVVETTAVVVVPAASSSSVVPSILLPSSLSSSSSSSSSLSSSSSSSTTVVQTTPVVIPTPSSQSALSKSSTAFRNLPQTTFVPSGTSAAYPSTTSSTTSSGISTGSIVGIAAASLAGVIVLGIVGVYCLKRYFNSRDDDDARPSSTWMRNSVALPDEAQFHVSRGPSANPRPPTMIERKQTQNFSNIGSSRYPHYQDGYPQDQGGYDNAGYPQENMGMGYSGYQDSPYGVQPMPSFNPGEHVGSSAQPFFSPIASPALVSPAAASFDESMPPMQHASLDGALGAPVYFSRRDSNMSGAQTDISANLDNVPNPHDTTDSNGYATLNRSSVTAYQAQQYAAISRQLSSPVRPDSSAEQAAAPSTPAGQQSPFEDPAPAPASAEGEYQELTLPNPVHPHNRIDSSPPMLPPMRTMSPVGAVGAQSSIIQIASAFPAAPMSPSHTAFPSNVTHPSSPKAGSFKQGPPLSPAPGAQGQLVSVPPAVHVGRETPVQFGFSEPGASGSRHGSPELKVERRSSVVPKAKRMSTASKKSVAKSERPETMYDEEDAYGGI